MILQVVADGWQQPRFHPGQFVSLGLFGFASRSKHADVETTPPPSDKLICRAYSIASPAFVEDFLEFYIALVPTGMLSPRLFKLEIGDRIWLAKKVVGRFTFQDVPENANVVLLANGTGLAPFMSMLGSHLNLAIDRKVALIHGVRHSSDLGYRSTLMAMQHLRSAFTYLPVVSRPSLEPVPWTGAVGHVQDVWKSHELEKAWGSRPTPEDTHVFLCGSPLMVRSMTDFLTQDGFAEHSQRSPGQIHSEKYWIEPTRSVSGHRAPKESSSPGNSKK